MHDAQQQFCDIKPGTHAMHHSAVHAFIDALEYYTDLPGTGKDLMWVQLNQADMKLYNSITQAQYDEFVYYYTWDALKGLRYGQAFCERFDISNASPLYHFKEHSTADRWIRDNYLVKNEG
jgi:hypothetical protein